MAIVNYQDRGLNKGYGSIAGSNQEVAINFNDCIIENTICLRFPHLLEQINEILDDKSLTKCKEVSRIMCSITENQKSRRFFTERVIQSYIKNSRAYGKEWKIVLNKLGIKGLKEFEGLVKGFYKDKSRQEFWYQWSPLHIAAERGHIDFCKWIAKFITLKCYQWSPLHFSVQAGWLEVSKFLYKEFDEKYTIRIFYGVQHLAAKNGHLDIYKFLHESSNDINPTMQEQITPLHFAAQYGHFDICKYICDNTVLVNPFRSDGNTPLSLAVHRGHIKVARLLYGRNHPMLRIAWTIFFLLIIMALTFNIYAGSHFSGSFYLFVLYFAYTVYIMILCIISALTIWEIVNDIRFCLWTSSKLVY